MEWLEFNGWSPEVVQSLFRQHVRAGAVARGLRAATTVRAAETCTALLARMPRTNPWGHPPAEC